MNQIRIVGEGLAAQNYRIIWNNVDISSHVHSVSLHMDTQGGENTAVLTIPAEIELIGDFHVELTTKRVE